MSTLWIGSKPELREDVAQLYEKYKDRMGAGMLMQIPPPGGEKNFYVYEWFTKDAGKIFYVGKGTGSRYRHIIYDMKRPRGACYKELQDHFGIDYRFLAKDLTSYEAAIYELCMLVERTDQGEVLLQSANNPGVWDCFSFTHMRKACNGRDFIPAIIVDPYERRYFGVEPPNFDPVDLSKLRVTFRSSGAQIKPIPATLQEMEQLREMIVKAGGRVYSTVAKGTQAIVEFDMMYYDRFMDYKEKGLLVYHAFDVVRCLKDQSSVLTI